MTGSNAQQPPVGDGPASPHARAWSDIVALHWMRARGQAIGLALSCIAAVLVMLQADQQQGVLMRPRLLVFDAYQSLMPRVREAGPVTIVEINEDSLKRVGQWPWPRTQLARLIDQVNAMKPVAIGLDMLLVEPDRMSPGAAEWFHEAPQDLRAWLTVRGDNDAIFAQSLKGAPIAIGIAGLDQATPRTGPLTPSQIHTVDPEKWLRRYDGAMRSLPIIDNAAAGHGILSVDMYGDGIIRRLPLVTSVNGQPVPSLDLEMLRLAVGANWFTLTGDDGGLTEVAVGALTIPVQRDGHVWVHFGPRDAGRFVSAADILDGTADPAMINKRLVLIGVTGLGLVDYVTTPLAERMPGVEVRAQLLENIFADALLQRPRWAGMLEGGLTLMFGVASVLLLPRLRPRWLPFPWLVGSAFLLGLGAALYAHKLLLIDVATPWLAGSGVFVVQLALVLAHADQERRRFQREVELRRAQEARMAGELDAARRIQMGILPRAKDITDPQGRIDVAAMLEPAKEVGGDLYDIFLLDENRLFFMVGDVAGKGIPASLFMALGKSLYKSTALRLRDEIAHIMSEANREIARDNSEMLFITAFAGILDLRTGALTYCNAGHDAPILLAPNEAPGNLEGVGGPPLGIFDDTQYPGESVLIAPGATLVIITDGVTEAMTPDGELYGAERVRHRLATTQNDADAQTILETVYDDIKQYAQGAEPSDDITIMVVRWRGPNPNGC